MTSTIELLGVSRASWYTVLPLALLFALTEDTGRSPVSSAPKPRGNAVGGRGLLLALDSAVGLPGSDVGRRAHETGLEREPCLECERGGVRV